MVGVLLRNRGCGCPNLGAQDAEHGQTQTSFRRYYGPCYVSRELATYLAQHEMAHTRGAPYHPMTQGKIERYHRSMKNVVKLENHYSPWELERAVGRFVEHYNHRRYHEALQNVTPADVYAGRQAEILAQRERIKRTTLKQRRRENLRAA